MADGPLGHQEILGVPFITSYHFSLDPWQKKWSKTGMGCVNGEAESPYQDLVSWNSLQDPTPALNLGEFSSPAEVGTAVPSCDLNPLDPVGVNHC